MNEIAIQWLQVKLGYLEWYVKEYPKCITTKDKQKDISKFQQAIDILSNSKVIAEGEFVHTQVGDYVDGREVELYKLNGTKIKILQIDK